MDTIFENDTTSESIPMKKLLPLILLSLLSALPLIAQEKPDRDDPETWTWVVEKDFPGYTHLVLESDSMQRKIGVNLYLPPSYESSPDRRYPVVYYLHGATGTEGSVYDLGSVVQRGIRQGRLEETIYVFPNAGHFSGYRDWPDKNIKAETWIISELIPYIDTNYRTINSRDGRALSGWSMGGGGSLRFLTKYPEMFCAAATFSAAIGYRIPEEITTVHNLRKNAEKLRGRIGIFMVVGEEDRLFDLYEPLIAELDKQKLEYKFITAPGVPHDLGKMKELYADQLVEFLNSHLAPATKGQAKE